MKKHIKNKSIMEKIVRAIMVLGLVILPIVLVFNYLPFEEPEGVLEGIMLSIILLLIGAGSMLLGVAITDWALERMDRMEESASKG